MTDKSSMKLPSNLKNYGNKIQISYQKEEYLKSFYQTLDKVARELTYLEMTEAKPFKEIAQFQRNLVSNNWPGYYAIYSGEVVGWVDITPASSPRLCHRGFLGMGLLPSFRGQGVGYNLLMKALDHAKKMGLEKVELNVYSENAPAIGLYKKCGFSEVGYIKNYRKLSNRYFDCIIMELSL